MHKIVSILIYICLNLFVLFLTRSFDYFCLSISITTILLALLTKFGPQLTGFTFRNSKAFWLMIMIGVALLLFLLMLFFLGNEQN